MFVFDGVAKMTIALRGVQHREAEVAEGEEAVPRGVKFGSPLYLWTHHTLSFW
jgi:hypothetical protein